MDQQHLGCIRAPKYGHKDGPLSLCQSHKRVGMYTNRNGKLLIATREGSGELLFVIRGRVFVDLRRLRVRLTCTDLLYAD